MINQLNLHDRFLGRGYLVGVHDVVRDEDLTPFNQGDTNILREFLVEHVIGGLDEKSPHFVACWRQGDRDLAPEGNTPPFGKVYIGDGCQPPKKVKHLCTGGAGS